MSENATWVAIADSGDLPPGEIKGVKLNGAEIALYNVDGSFYATDNVCSHAYALLSDGFLDGDVVECPLHAGAFDVKTGKASCAPCVVDIKSYPTRLAGTAVEILVG